MKTALALVLLVLLASRPAIAEPAAPARVVVVHDSELLGSESKLLAELEKKLSKKRPLTWVDAGPAEAGGARAWLSGAAIATAAPLPSEWLAAGVVVVLEVLPAAGKKPNRITRGLGGVLLFKPPAARPIYVERIDGNADVSLRTEALVDWLARAMALAAQGAP